MDLAAAAAEALPSLWSMEALIAFLTLTALEVVLGIDNIVFIAVLAGRLPEAQRARARRLGLALAMFSRIALLLALGWVMGLTAGLFEVPRFWTGAAGDAHPVSGRDLILLGGGLFLVAKATWEIHDKLEGEEHGGGAAAVASFAGVLFQILLLDLVFSLDSVITAVGMVRTAPDARWVGITIMVAAIVVAVLIMLVFAGKVSDFVERHPTVKMLALSFLILIGVILVAEGLHFHVPKGYVYFAIGFSLGVEMLNLRLRRKRQPVHLHQTYVAGQGEQAPGLS